VLDLNSSLRLTISRASFLLSLEAVLTEHAQHLLLPSLVFPISHLSPWLPHHHSSNTTLFKQHYYSNPRARTSSIRAYAASMMSLVPTRKRKDTPNRRWGSREKDKIRLIEHSGQDLVESTAKPAQRRTSTPAGRTLTNFRKSSIRIFSLLRGGKGTIGATLYVAMC
jgi:hypothetical protein